jgi:inner membrane protein
MWGIAISSSYLIYAFNHKIKVDSIVCKALQNENIRYSDFISTPTPLNNFLWYIIAPCEEGYHIGYYSVFDLSEKIRFHFLPRNDSLIETLKNNESIKKLIRFSTGYYHIEKSNDTLFYSDLRFGQVGGWDSGDASFVFRYNLAENSDNKMFIQSGRLRASSGATLKSMIARITAHQ